MSEPKTLRHWLLGVAIAIDQLVNAWFWGNPDETISSRVGRAAVAGKRWGLIGEAIIDRLFMLLGEGPGHCRRNIEWAVNRGGE